MQLGDIPSSLEGYVVFYSYTFIFRFGTRLKAGTDHGVYYCEIPSMIETFDRRRFARLRFESRENKVITIYNKSFNTRIKGILQDIGVGGLGFVVVDIEQAPKIDDIIVTNVELPEISFQAMAKVVYVRNSEVGCAFLEDSKMFEKNFQLELNGIIKSEIDWRSELMLQNLKKREEIVVNFKKSFEKTSTDITVSELITKRNALDSIVDFFIRSFHIVTGVVLSKEKIEYRESSAIQFSNALKMDVGFYDDLLFSVYFSAQREVLHKLAVPIFRGKLSGMTINSSIVLEELGKQWAKYSESPDNTKKTFTLCSPDLVDINKRTLSELLKRASVNVRFTSSVGDFSIILLSDNMIDSMNICSNARAREFITMEKMDLIEPISYAALRVFSEFLNLEIREKSVTHRDQLIPRFEISIILDIFFEECEGKVILNLSKRLALKIYELLLNEKVEEFNNEVKDAVAEVTNMITGNAKSEFEKHGIYYKISTPVVLESREGVIIYARNMKFISSVYWTSEGFFDLSFSFYKKQ